MFEVRESVPQVRQSSGGRRFLVLCTLVVLPSIFLARRTVADPAKPEDRSALDARLSEAIALDAIVSEAARAGLPTDLLDAKIKEGEVKHVSLARLVPVVRALAARLEAAAALCHERFAAEPPAATRPLYRAVVEARGQAVSIDDVRRVLSAAETVQTATTALDTTTDLVVLGYPRDAVARLVSKVAHDDPAALDHLASDTERARARGASALGALEAALPDEHRDRQHQRGNGGDADSSGRGTPSDVGPDRESIGARGKALGLARSKGKGQGKP